MKANKTWKRVASGLLALAITAGGTPVNIGDFLTGVQPIVASAMEVEEVSNGDDFFRAVQDPDVDVIKLTADIDISEVTEDIIKIQNPLIIDGGGKTITCGSKRIVAYDEVTIQNVTLTGYTPEDTKKDTAPITASATATTSANLILKDVDVVNNTGNYAVRAWKGNVTIQSGKFVGGVRSLCVDTGNVITVESGLFNTNPVDAGASLGTATLYALNDTTYTFGVSSEAPQVTAGATIVADGEASLKATVVRALLGALLLPIRISGIKMMMIRL